MNGPLDITYPPNGVPGSSITESTNVPAISSSTTALQANSSRRSWHIQNLGINTLFVRLGDGATTSVFHIVLRGGTGANDGLGGTYEQSGTVYTGKVTIAGTSPSYVVMEA